MLGRESNTPLDLLYGRPEEEKEEPRYCDYVEDQQKKLEEAYELARNQLKTTAKRAKKLYDMKVRPVETKVGDFVWYYCPRRVVGRSPKLQRYYSGPFLIIEILGKCNVRLQKSSRAAPFVTHLDKIKKCYSPGLRSWLETATDSNERIESEGPAEGQTETEEVLEVTQGRPKREVKKPKRYVQEL